MSKDFTGEWAADWFDPAAVSQWRIRWWTTMTDSWDSWYRPQQAGVLSPGQPLPGPGTDTMIAPPQPSVEPAWPQPAPPLPPSPPLGYSPEKKGGLRRLLDTPRKRILAAIGAVVVLAAVVTLVVLTATGPRHGRASRVGSLESVDATRSPGSSLDPLIVPTAPAAMMSPTPAPTVVPSATAAASGSTAAAPAGTAQPPAASPAPAPPSDPKAYSVALSVSGGVIVASPSSLTARVGDSIVLTPSGFSLYDTLLRVTGGIERTDLYTWKATAKGTATILAYIAGGTPEATILTVTVK